MALSPIEQHLRPEDEIQAASVVRGWPLTVEGILRNADATRRRYSWKGEPLVAVSAEATVAGWTVDSILAGPRLASRLRFAVATAAAILVEGFELLPTFGAPHISVVLPSYNEDVAKRLLELLGSMHINPFYVRRHQ